MSENINSVEKIPEDIQREIDRELEADSLCEFGPICREVDREVDWVPQARVEGVEESELINTDL